MASPQQVADILFARIESVTAENARLKRIVARCRLFAIAGKDSVANDGATAWRDALDTIIAIASGKK